MFPEDSLDNSPTGWAEEARKLSDLDIPPSEHPAALRRIIEQSARSSASSAREPQAPFLSVVCPMFNEAERIVANVRMLLQHLDGAGRTFEVLLVNDGSTDDTLEQAAGLLEGTPCLRIITYPRNRGRGFAIRAGFEHAQGDVVVVTESDLSWGADIVERLTRHLVAHDLDAVVASPHSAGGRLENIPWDRVLLPVLGNRVLSLLMPVRLTMYTGMTRAYRRDVLPLLDLRADDKELHLEIISELARNGCRIGEIPAILRWRAGESRRRRFRAKRYILSHLAYGLKVRLTGILAWSAVLSLCAALWAGRAEVSPAHDDAAPFELSGALALLAALFGVASLVSARRRKLQDDRHRMNAKLRHVGVRDAGGGAPLTAGRT